MVAARTLLSISAILLVLVLLEQGCVAQNGVHAVYFNTPLVRYPLPINQIQSVFGVVKIVCVKNYFYYH